MESQLGARQVALCCLAVVCFVHCVDARFFDDSSSENREKRSYLDPTCRRCLFDPDDWWSCHSCYGRPGGLIPYYGFGFKKRSQPEIQEQVAASVEQQEPEAGVAKREAFLTCLCCTSLTSQECCERCSLTSYYGKRNAKRSYETSFAGYSDFGMGGACSCCDRDPYNFSCCSLECSKRRRK